MDRYLFLLVVLTNGLSSEAGCGKPRYSAHSRVVNGNDAVPHSIPWQVSIEKNGQHTCGGSLITRSWVLTAAHCVHKEPDPSKYMVVVGLHKLNGKTLYTRAHRVSQVIKNKRYRSHGTRNDIAMMRLTTPATLNKAVDTICLPRPGTSPPPGWKCVVSGWGSTFGGSPSANTLQQAELPIVDHLECDMRNGYIQPIMEKEMICAGGNGKGACHGDSGGPLACNEVGKWFIRGVVSWGDEHCRTGYYSVFARVTNYLDWIDENINAAGGGTGGLCEDKQPLLCTKYRETQLCKRPDIQKECALSCNAC